MKSKTYWKNERDTGDVFGVSKKIARALIEVANNPEAQDRETTARYLWVRVSGSGAPDSGDTQELSCDEWMGIVDEAAALGAEWLAIQLGDSFDTWPHIWTVCKWAQQNYDMRLGLHIREDCVTNEVLERLTMLDTDRTFIFAPGSLVPKLSRLTDAGLTIIDDALHTCDIKSPCSNSREVVCVDKDGSMYSCGLVLGDENYEIGSALGRSFHSVMTDETLPNEAPGPQTYTSGNCDGCPAEIAQRLAQVDAEHGR